MKNRTLPLLTALGMVCLLSGCDVLPRGVLSPSEPRSADLSYSPAAIFFDRGIEQTIQPGATLSVPLRVILAENEEPIPSLFGVDEDASNQSFFVQGATVVKGPRKLAPYRVETIEVMVTAPEVNARALKPCRINAPRYSQTRELLKQLDNRFGMEFLLLAVNPSETTWILQQAPDKDVEFRSVLTDRHKFISSEATYSVITSEAELDAFYEKFSASWGGISAFLSLPRPSVDFAAETLVVMAFGSQSSGAVSGEIARIREFSDKLMVVPIRWLPAPWRMVTADIGNPIHMVALSKPHKPLMFAPIHSAWDAGPRAR